jgi:hypothetical protein
MKLGDLFQRWFALSFYSSRWWHAAVVGVAAMGNGWPAAALAAPVLLLAK